jgi:hypothetical protein
MEVICEICKTDPAVEKHHVRPKSKGGTKGEVVWCCSDCGGQFHTLFTNNDLADKSLEQILEDDKMKDYISWKKKHPGPHRHRMSTTVKQWKRGHR